MAARPYNIFLAGALIGLLRTSSMWTAPQARGHTASGSLSEPCLGSAWAQLPWLGYHLASKLDHSRRPNRVHSEVIRSSAPETWQWSFSPNEVWAFPADLPDHGHILEHAPEPGFDLATFHRTSSACSLKSVRDRARETGPLRRGLSNRPYTSALDRLDIHGVRNSLRDVPLDHPVHTRGSAAARCTRGCRCTAQSLRQIRL